MKLDLKNVAENIGVLADEYNLLLVGHNDRYLVFDGDAEEMFADSGVQQMDGEIYKAINWYFDKDTGFIEGCQEHDYLESIVLLQDGIYYVCQVFAESCDGGCGCLDYALAIFNVREAQENEVKMILAGSPDTIIEFKDENADGCGTDISVLMKVGTELTNGDAERLQKLVNQLKEEEDEWDTDSLVDEIAEKYFDPLNVEHKTFSPAYTISL